MTEELRVRNYSERSVTSYLSSISQLSLYYKISPDKITRDQVKSYAYYLIHSEHASVSRINQLISAWKILQVDVLGNQWEEIRLKRPRREKNIPQVLSQDEALALIGSLSNMKHRMILTLTYHPHIHMLVPAGGLSEDGMEWIQSGKKFFVHVKALSAMFRGILIRMIKEQWDKNALKLPDGFPDFSALKKKLYEKNWNVYSKKALGGVNSVLAYLGRYTHRVAISNSRILSVENGKVTFRYKNYQKKGRQQVMTISCAEFVHRFMMHILPNGFYKIRYYGILATANIKTKREQAIVLIGKVVWQPMLEGLNAYEVYRTLRGNDPARCPKCKKGTMIRHGIPAATG